MIGQEVVSLHIRPMNLLDAKRLNRWKYPGEYAQYNLDGIANELYKSGALVACYGPILIGYYCFNDAARVPAGTQLLAYPEPDCLDIGLGMAPWLCGRGRGLAFLQKGMAYARHSLGTRRFRLTVLANNLRAIAVYQKAGFVYTRSFSVVQHEGPLQFYVMFYEPRERTAS